MQPADGSTVLGDFADSSFTQYGVTSTFFRRNGKYFVRTDGPDGALRDYEIAYTFGADPLQQYLVRFPGGRFQALGIAWDTRPRSEGGQRWFHLYPGQAIAHDDELHWTGLNQNWNFMCAECHSTHVKKNYLLEEDRYETTWAEIDVSCDACHGPGSAHVAWAEAAARGAAPEDDPDMGLRVRFGDDASWIFDRDAAIARRSRPRSSNAEIETCGRCHARRATQSEEYLHGRPLMDTHRPALLDETLYHTDGQILDEVYVYGSFLQSRMHAKGVSCSDCHDPHSLKLQAEGNALCGRCHQPARYDVHDHHFHEPGTAAARCVACHMPARTYMVVDPRHDHSFRVPRPDLSVELGTPNACTVCHADRSLEWAAEAVVNWYGPNRSAAAHFGEALYAGRRGLPHAERALAQLAEDAAQPPIVRATALRLLRTRLGAGSVETVERALRDEDPLVRLAALEALEALEPRARLGVARPLLRDPVRAVRLQAVSTLLTVPANVWDPRDRAVLADAVAEYREAQRANADRPDAHLNLGLLHTQFGELEQARAAYEKALGLDPRFLPAYANLADLYRMLGRDEEGERWLRQGLEIAPDRADVHHALGLLLVRQRRMPEALEALRRAAELDAQGSHYAYVYALALHEVGRREEALAVLEQAHERRPGDREPLLALATIRRDQGDLSAALGYARKLVELSPGDPGAQSLIEQLEAARQARSLDPGLGADLQ
jgi:tetratricopeptide (TPR) repeat protein